MSQYKVGVGEQDSDSSQAAQDASRSEQKEHEQQLQRMREEEKISIQEDPLARATGSILDKADTLIYATVGFCFLLGALIALAYTFWSFGISIFVELPKQVPGNQPGQLAGAIIDFVSGLLLVLIIMEVLGTIIHYIKSHETSLRPFLVIGIISAVRSILSVGARLSVGNVGPHPEDFPHAMIELGVSAAVVLALGITLKLLGRLVEVGSSEE